MKALHVLRKARAILEKPENWTQGAYHRAHSEGALVKSDAANGTCHTFPTWGLMLETQSALAYTLKKGEPSIFPIVEHELIEFNDHWSTTHEKVLNLLDRTIETWQLAAQ